MEQRHQTDDDDEIQQYVSLDAEIECDEVLDLFSIASNLALASTCVGTAPREWSWAVYPWMT